MTRLRADGGGLRLFPDNPIQEIFIPFPTLILARWRRCSRFCLGELLVNAHVYISALLLARACMTAVDITHARVLVYVCVCV